MYIFLKSGIVMYMNSKRSPIIYFSCDKKRGFMEKPNRDQPRDPDGMNPWVLKELDNELRESLPLFL